jgi:hypothetical protein
LDKKFSLERYVNGEILRVVYAMQDPTWVFYDQGEIQLVDMIYLKKDLKNGRERE